jgi:hypothetical protein
MSYGLAAGYVAGQDGRPCRGTWACCGAAEPEPLSLSPGKRVDEQPGLGDYLTSY